MVGQKSLPLETLAVIMTVHQRTRVPAWRRGHGRRAYLLMVLVRSPQFDSVARAGADWR